MYMILFRNIHSLLFRNFDGFNHFFRIIGQFFRNIFSSKSKRQAAKQAEEQAMMDGEMVDMKIEAPQKSNKDERRKR